MKNVNETTSSTKKEVLITHIFNAPRELVFKAWTDPEQLLRWYAPDGCTIEFKSIDIRPGGTFHSCITSPDMKHCWCIGTYQEVIFPVRLVQTVAVADENGNPVDPAAIGMHPEWPAETLLTITFEELGSKTKLTLHQTVDEDIAKQMGAHPSWIKMLNRLDEILK